MSGPVTFTGLFSGLDTASIVEALMNIERRPLTVLQDRQSETQEKLSVFQDLESRLASLDSAVQTLNLAGTVNAKTATSSNTNALGVSASASAATGNFTVDSITQLARAASEASIGVTDKTADFVSGSTFSFDVGTQNISITLGEGQLTLEGLRDAINADSSAARSRPAPKTTYPTSAPTSS